MTGGWFDRAESQIRLANGAKINLGALFPEWLETDPKDRRAFVERVVESLSQFDPEQQFDVVSDHILPLVRNRSQVENEWPDDDGDPTDWPLIPIAGFLCALPAVDRDAGIAVVNHGILQAWGRSLTQVMALAVENLRARSTFAFERQPDGFYCSVFGDHYDASRLLLPDLFRLGDIRGEPVAVVLSRGAVVFAGDQDRDALRAMAVFVEEAMKSENRPIAYAPVVLSGDEWRPYLADDDPAIARLVRLHQHWDYGRQRAVLEARFGAEGREQYVGEVDAVMTEEGMRLWATWTRGIPTLLPKVDVLMLNEGPGGRAGARRWEDVEAVCGPFAREPGAWPPRYVAPTTPAREDWDRLFEDFQPAAGFDDPAGL